MVSQESAPVPSRPLLPLQGSDSSARGRALTQVLYSCTTSISGLVAEYIVAIDVTRVQFPDDADQWSPWAMVVCVPPLILAGCVQGSDNLLGH